MILVFIFLGILLFLSIVILLLMTCNLKIKIKNLEIGHVAKQNKKYEILIQLYIFNKLKIFSIKLNNKKIREIYTSKKIEKIDFKKIKKLVPIDKETINIIKQLKLKIEKMDLKIGIGMERADITSYFVALIATIIEILLIKFTNDKDKKECKYVVKPIYNGTLTVNLHLDSIINLKIVHIIYVIYHLAKKGMRIENERTSNRRSYDYSHGCN